MKSISLAALVLAVLFVVGCASTTDTELASVATTTPAAVRTEESAQVEASPIKHILEQMRTTSNWGNPEASKRRNPYKPLDGFSAVRDSVRELHYATEMNTAVGIYYMEHRNATIYVALQVVGPEDAGGVRRAFGNYAAYARKSEGSSSFMGISFSFEGFLNPDGVLRFAHGGRTYSIEIGERGEESRLFASNFYNPRLRQFGIRVRTVAPKLMRLWGRKK